MKHLLAAHFKTLSESLQINFSEARKHSDKKSIHALRVSLKKLRAMMLVLNSIEPEVKFKKENRRLRKLFKEAGLVRNFHVRTNIIMEFSPPKNGFGDFNKKLKQETREQNSRFKKKLAKFEEKKILKKIATEVKAVSAVHNNKSVAASVSGFAKKNIKKALRLSDKNSLHKSRMKLKSAHYALDITKDDRNSTALIATIDPVEQKLGRWQDCSITSQLLAITKRKFKKSKIYSEKHRLNGELAKEISQLETQVRKDFVRLRKMLPGLFPDKHAVR